MYPEQRGHVRSVILFGNRIDGRSTRCDQTETMHGHETPHRSFTIEYLKNKCSRRIFFDLYFINTCELDFTRFLQERKHKMIMPTKHYSHLTRVHDALLSIHVVTNTLTMEIYGTRNCLGGGVRGGVHNKKWTDIFSLLDFVR